MIQKSISWRVFLPLLHFVWQSFHGPFGSHALKMFCMEKRLCLHGFFRVTSAVVTSIKHAIPLTSKSKNQGKKRVVIFCMWCCFLVSRRVKVFQSSMISIQQTLHKTEINKLQNSYTLLPYMLAWITVCKHWAKKSSLQFAPDRYRTEIWERHKAFGYSLWLSGVAFHRNDWILLLETFCCASQFTMLPMSRSCCISMLCCGQSAFINQNLRQQKVFRCMVVANQRLVFSSDASVERRDNQNFIFGIDS